MGTSCTVLYDYSFYLLVVVVGAGDKWMNLGDKPRAAVDTRRVA
jgi:hypothetical protein